MLSKTDVSNVLASSIQLISGCRYTIIPTRGGYLVVAFRCSGTGFFSYAYCLSIRTVKIKHGNTTCYTFDNAILRNHACTLCYRGIRRGYEKVSVSDNVHWHIEHLPLSTNPAKLCHHFHCKGEKNGKNEDTAKYRCFLQKNTQAMLQL